MNLSFITKGFAAFVFTILGFFGAHSGTYQATTSAPTPVHAESAKEEAPAKSPTDALSYSTTSAQQVAKTSQSQSRATTTPKTAINAGISQRKALLAALRQKPYFDDTAAYQLSDQCHDASSNNGLTISNYDDVADLSITDAQGNYTGPTSDNPYGYKEGIREIQDMELGGRHFLILEQPIDANVYLVGKKDNIEDVRFGGNGNNCAIAEVHFLMTGHSKATIPMSKAGDLGPISLDIDGDGVEDVQISLVHPLLPEKEKQLEAVFSDITGAQLQ